MAGGGSIQQQVAAILAGQQAPVNLAFRQAGAQAAAQQAKINSERLALVRLLQSGVGPAGHAYDQAVGQQQALAHSAAAGLAASSPDPQMQANLRAIGAPASQQAALGAQNRRDFAGQGAVLYTGQGAIPGASLVAQKSAAQQYLAGLPTVAALGGEQTLRGLGAQQAKVRDAYLQEVARIQGQAPGLVQNAEATQAANQARIDSLNAENAYRAAELQQGQERIGISRQRANQAALAKNTQAQQKKAAAGLKAQKARGTAVKNRATARTRAIAKALGIPEYTTQTVTTPGDYKHGLPPTSKTVKTRVPYATIKREAMGRPEVQLLWTRFGYTRQQVSDMVDAALKSKGVQVPLQAPPGAGTTGAYGNQGPRSNRAG